MMRLHGVRNLREALTQASRSAHPLTGDTTTTLQCLGRLRGAGVTTAVGVGRKGGHGGDSPAVLWAGGPLV